ncbi:MAG: hypothetical protein AAB518_00115 [Patescibacteria group bacterium]
MHQKDSALEGRKKILIVGGGFGGVAAALALRRGLAVRTLSLWAMARMRIMKLLTNVLGS